MARPRKTKHRLEHDRAIGQRLTALRRARGFTQAQLAEKLGVAQSVISHYERGRAGIDSRILLELARILGVSADDVLGLRAQEKPAAVRRTFLRRLEKIETLSKRDQQALLRTIDAFLSKAS